MKPLLLGEAPSKAGDRYYMVPLSGRPAEFICRLMGWGGKGAAYWRLTERFDTLNVIERYADAYPWRVQVARDRWTRWLVNRPEEEQRRPLVVVCLGRKPAEAVGLTGDRPWGAWLEAGLLQATVVPHTSGRNLVLNDPKARDRMRETLAEAIQRAEAARWEGTVA